MTTNKSTDKILVYALIVFAFLIAINALLIRYPVNVVLPSLKAIGLLAVIFIYGISVLLLFNKKTENIEFPDVCGIGLIFTTFYFYLVSFLKILVPFTILLFYLLPLVLLYFILKKKREIVQHALLTFFKRPAREYALFIFPFIYASLPSSFYDTLVYHLGIPNLYLQHQGFIPTPQFFYANTSIYYEISLIPAVFAGDIVPQIFHFLLGVVFIFMLIDLAARFFQLKDRFILLLLVISMPITVFLLSTVKNDLLSAFFILAGIKYYLDNKIKCSALSWGFAIGIKYFNTLPLAIFLVLVFLKEKKINFKVIIIFGIIITAVLLPLFIKNYIFTGNPIFPFLGGYFPQANPYFDASRFAAMRADVGQIIHSWQDLLKLPYTLSFYEMGSGGLMGAQFLIFLPFIIIAIKRRENRKSLLLLFALLFLLVGCYFTAQVRFMYAAIVLLAVFTVMVYESLDALGIKIMKSLFFLVIGLNLVTAFGYQERICRAHYLYSGKSASIDEYLEVAFPTYPAIAYVNKNTPGDANILLVGEARNYYLKRPYYVSSSLDYSILKKYLSAGPGFQDFIAALKQDKIRCIIYNAKEFERLQKVYQCLAEEEMTRSVDFLNHLNPVFTDRNGELYVFEII
ncbi:MAG: hypothetical protein QG657_1920 [Acidobacteriota bacterium]|nr:hypothetical protein [Acidobacteriota bacterium]